MINFSINIDIYMKYYFFSCLLTKFQDNSSLILYFLHDIGEKGDNFRNSRYNSKINFNNKCSPIFTYVKAIKSHFSDL